MLNMKKGLAIVLAAATAFTFAPVSMLGNPVVASAATRTYASDVSSVEASSLTLSKSLSGSVVLTLKAKSGVKFESGDEIAVSATSSETTVVNTISSSNLAITPVGDGSTGTVTVPVTAINRGTTTLSFTVGTEANAATSTVTANYDTKAEILSTSGSINSKPSVQNGTAYDLIGNDVEIKYVAANSSDVKTYQGKELTWALQAYTTKATDNLGLEVGTKSDPSLTGLATLSSTGRLDVTKAADFVAATTGTNKIALVGIVNDGSKNIEVYAEAFSATAVKGQITTVDASVSAKPDTDYTTETNKNTISEDFLDGIRFEDATGHYKKFDPAGTIAVVKSGTDAAKFKVTLGSNSDNDIAATSVGDYPLKGAKLNTATGVTSLPAGVYHFTLTVTYDTDYAEVINVTVTVGAGPKIRVFEGANIYGSTISGDKKAADPTIYLDLQNNKTFDISKNIFSDTANTTYKYKTNTAGVTVDSNGLITAVRAGTATVTVTPTAAGVEGAAVDLEMLMDLILLL